MAHEWQMRNARCTAQPGKRTRALEASGNNQKNARAAPCGAAPVKVMGMQLGSFSLHEQHIAREPT